MSQAAIAQEPTGAELIRRLALEALNKVHRDRFAARRLFKQWIKERDDLFEAIAGAAVDQAIASAVGRDLRQERRDVLRLARAAPRVTSGVPVGPLPAGVAQRRCLPVASPEAELRRAANILHPEGLLAFKLPTSGKMLGLACAWEVKDAFLAYDGQRRSFANYADFMKRVWMRCPDKERPASEQRPVQEYMSAAQLQELDEQARIAQAKVIV